MEKNRNSAEIKKLKKKIKFCSKHFHIKKKYEQNRQINEKTIFQLHDCLVNLPYKDV